MICLKCRNEIPEDSAYCNYCGKPVFAEFYGNKKRRGNGTGSVIKLSKNNYKAIVVIGYKENPECPNDKTKLLPVRRTKSGFKTKSQALAYIPTLQKQVRTIDKTLSLKEIYDLWQPTHTTCSQKTLDGYKYAFKYFKDLWYAKFSEIGIDDYQECIDDCEKGKRTKQNMKILINLLYKYAIPRGYTEDKINLGTYLVVRDDGIKTPRKSFTEAELEKIRAACGVVPYAEYILCLCYTGFRPSEFISLKVEDYNKKERCFIGGAKTEAGIDRAVTVSPKIQKHIDAIIGDRKKGNVFTTYGGDTLTYEAFRDLFYPALNSIGIDNPTTLVDGKQLHKYTPHSCRHMFATLMKRVAGPSKDKLGLIGHTNEEMLRYYQDIDYEDLRKITDKI